MPPADGRHARVAGAPAAGGCTRLVPCTNACTKIGHALVQSMTDRATKWRASPAPAAHAPRGSLPAPARLEYHWDEPRKEQR